MLKRMAPLKRAFLHVLREKKSVLYFLYYGRCKQIKIAKQFFAVSNLEIQISAVIIGSFRKSPVAHRSTNCKGPEKSREPSGPLSLSFWNRFYPIDLKPYTQISSMYRN